MRRMCAQHGHTAHTGVWTRIHCTRESAPLPPPRVARRGAPAMMRHSAGSVHCRDGTWSRVCAAVPGRQCPLALTATAHLSAQQHVTPPRQLRTSETSPMPLAVGSRVACMLPAPSPFVPSQRPPDRKAAPKSRRLLTVRISHFTRAACSGQLLRSHHAHGAGCARSRIACALQATTPQNRSPTSTARTAHSMPGRRRV